MEEPTSKMMSLSCTRFARGATSPRGGPRASASHTRLFVARARQMEGGTSHDAGWDDSDDETKQFNSLHLSALAARIEEVKRASTLHFLEYGYQVSTRSTLTP